MPKVEILINVIDQDAVRKLRALHQTARDSFRGVREAGKEGQFSLPSEGIRGFRESLHVIRPLLHSVGVEMRGLREFGEVGSAGIGALAAVLGVTLLAALEKVADSAAKAKRALSDLGVKPEGAEKVASGLHETLETTAGDIAKLREATQPKESLIGPNQVYHPTAGAAPNDLPAAEQTLTKIFRLGAPDETEARKQQTDFLNKFGAARGLTPEISRGLEAGTARVFGKALGFKIDPNSKLSTQEQLARSLENRGADFANQQIAFGGAKPEQFKELASQGAFAPGAEVLKGIQRPDAQAEINKQYGELQQKGVASLEDAVGHVRVAIQSLADALGAADIKKYVQGFADGLEAITFAIKNGVAPLLKALGFTPKPSNEPQLPPARSVAPAPPQVTPGVSAALTPGAPPPIPRPAGTIPTLQLPLPTVASAPIVQSAGGSGSAPATASASAEGATPTVVAGSDKARGDEFYRLRLRENWQRTHPGEPLPPGYAEGGDLNDQSAPGYDTDQREKQARDLERAGRSGAAASRWQSFLQEHLGAAGPFNPKATNLSAQMLVNRGQLIGDLRQARSAFANAFGAGRKWSPAGGGTWTQGSYRDGGPIIGPGSGTSDSITDHFDKGGFILSARASARAGRSALKSLHDMARGYANGGKIAARVSHGEEYFDAMETRVIGSSNLHALNRFAEGGPLGSPDSVATPFPSSGDDSPTNRETGYAVHLHLGSQQVPISTDRDSVQRLERAAVFDKLLQIVPNSDAVR